MSPELPELPQLLCGRKPGEEYMDIVPPETEGNSPTPRARISHVIGTEDCFGLDPALPALVHQLIDRTND